MRVFRAVSALAGGIDDRIERQTTTNLENLDQNTPVMSSTHLRLQLTVAGGPRLELCGRWRALEAHQCGLAGELLLRMRGATVAL